MSDPTTPASGEGEDGGSRRSSGQRSQLPTRVSQLSRQLSSSGASGGWSTLPRSGRERERLSQRRAVTSNTFLLRDSGRAKPLRRPASAADVDRKKGLGGMSAVPTAAVSTPSLASPSASASATPRPSSALRTSSRAESLPRKQSRVTILTEEEKRKRELGWNSPQNLSKSMPRLSRPSPTTRKSSAPVVERLTRPAPLRKSQSFASSQPTIKEAAEEKSFSRGASVRLTSSGGKAVAAKVQTGLRKASPSSGNGKPATVTTAKTSSSATGKASISSKTSLTRVTSPGMRSTPSPGSRITSPEARVTSPDSRVTTPDSRVTSPISRNASPATRSLPASCRKRSRCSPVSDAESASGSCRRSSQPKLSDPSLFRPPSSLAKLSVTAKSPPPSFSRAAIPKEAGTEKQKERKHSETSRDTNTTDEGGHSEQPVSHNDSGVEIVGMEIKKQDVADSEETANKTYTLSEATVKRVEFSSNEVSSEHLTKTDKRETNEEAESISSAFTRDKLSVAAELPSPSSNLPSPDAHDLSHVTSASEETGYVSSASHSPPSRSASGSRAIGMVSAELVRRYGGGSSTLKEQASRRDASAEGREGTSAASSSQSESNQASNVGQKQPTGEKRATEGRDTKEHPVSERRRYDASSMYDMDRRGRLPQRSFHGPPRAGVSSATLDRFRRSSVTPDRLGGSLDWRRSGSSPSGDEAELALLRDTLLSPGAGTREDSPEGYRAGVLRLLRLSRRSAGFQQLKPNFQALQRLTETGPPAAELRQLAEGHVRSLLEQLEQQQRQRQQELQGAGDRNRASARWSGDVGLRFRGRSVEDLKRMFAAQSESPARPEPRSRSASQSRRGSCSSTLTQSQVGRLRQQLQQLHSADGPRRDVTSPTSTRSGYSVDVTDLGDLSNVLPVRPPPPQPPVRSHTSYSLRSRSTTLPSVSSSASSQPPVAGEERHQLVERSERLRRLREERVGRPMTSVQTATAPQARPSVESSSPPDAGLSPHLPNQVQKPPRVRDIPDDGFRSLPSSSRLRRQRAMASMQYIPHRTVSEQLRSAAEAAAEAAAGDDGGLVDEGDGPPGARVRLIPPELRREARETSHRSSAPPSLSWDVSDARRKPLPTPRSLDEASGEAQVECNHRPEPDPPRRRRPSVKKMLLSGFSSLRRKFRSRSGSRKRKVENVVVVKLSENGAGARAEVRERQAGNEQRPTRAPAVETKVMKVDAATSTVADTNVKRVVDSTHRVRTVGHIATGPSASAGRAAQPKSRRPPPEVSLIGQMFTSSPELAEVESLSRVWRQTGGPALRDEFRPVSNFSARTDGSAPGSSVVASTPVPPSESSEFSAVWRGPAEMDWSIHRPIGRYVPDAGPPGGQSGQSAPGGYRSLPRPRARRHPPPPTTGSLPRPVPRRTPCPCCTQPGGHRRGGQTSGGDGASRSAAGPRYQEAAVNIHYRSPVRWEEKEPLSEDELRRRQEDTMRRAYEEARRRKEERQAEDRESRRHGDNFTPSQKSPIPLDRYERLFDDVTDDRRPTLTASVLHEFRAQNNRELSLSRGETVRIRRKIDSNWYEGQKGTRIGIFPVTYVQVIDPRERSADRWSSRPQVRAKHRFSAQSAMELSLNKGDVVTILRRVDDNWYEGRRGDATGIFPASYVEPLTADHGDGGPRQKPVGAPAAHGLVMDGLSLRAPGERDQLRVDVKQNTMLYRVMFPYRHQNEDELDLEEGDMIQVLEQCPDGWYVGTNMRTGMFGTFPGNYTRRM
ncbi:serine/arginine repetitive matrix protein 2-like isoform X1 [Amphibalanus amphitrite]|uniref:serine/arginine repetitive matrix protein 2-like isoform X1 n=1 Tax=Amphibalanus amphitrite TaxID=1232801 RepID=UPI001C91A41D|nr:serine/arginine repetitive matrix protein 2-like isoform X1 [Amphibalanus amphitrite]